MRNSSFNLAISKPELSECMRACNECITACLQCAAACLKESSASMTRCITLDVKCADVCRFLTSAISRNSEHIAAIMDLCVRACERSAAECEKHDMDHCQRCARASRRCAEICRAAM